MQEGKITKHIVDWISDYVQNANLSGLVVGISGGVDSALTGTLACKTTLPTYLVNMPIRQNQSEESRGLKQIKKLEKEFSNCKGLTVSLNETFESFEKSLPKDIVEDQLSMANSRARLRMTTLYAIAQANSSIVVGTGNKVEDFGVGFFTKYGDGGVDISPIADLMKSEVYQLATYNGVIDEIIQAPPTDGLWSDSRNDEDQIGATYDELEWAMTYKGNEKNISERQKEVLKIFRKFHNQNLHKMKPIPVCKINKK